MSTGKRIPLNKAIFWANHFIENLTPICHRIEMAGSVRRQCQSVGDVEIVCVVQNELLLEQMFSEGFKGMVVNGPRLKRFKYPDSHIQVELYITTMTDWGRIFAIRTGSSAFSHIQLAGTWWKLGWAGTSQGLRRRTECVKKGSTWKLKPEFIDNATMPPAFSTERKFFEFLGVQWVEPSQRSWTSKHDKINYSR